MRTRRLFGFWISVFDIGTKVAIGPIPTDPAKPRRGVMAPIGPRGVRRTVIELTPQLRKCMEAGRV